MAKRNLPPPSVCPVCGHDVPRKALACSECGADYNSGWREGAEEYDGLDLPDEEFNYDQFVRKEFGRSSPLKPQGMKTIWWVTGIIVIVVTVVLFLLSLRW